LFGGIVVKGGNNLETNCYQTHKRVKRIQGVTKICAGVGWAFLPT